MLEKTFVLVALAMTLALGCGDDSDTSDGPLADAGGDGDGDGDAGTGGEPDASHEQDAALEEDAAVAAPVEPEPFDEDGCSASDVTPGMATTVELEHEGMTRKYILYVPEQVELAAPTPLVLNFHGLGSNAQQEQGYAGTAISDERGWIVAFPDGLGDPGGQSFNAGVCCSALGSPTHMADDAGFARAIVEDVAARLCVDKHRVYSTGMSNGGYMSEWNACKNADLFAAVAPVSAIGFMQTGCEPSRPIPMIAFNGTTDPLVSYAGSNVSIEQWRERNGCSEDVAREDFGDSYCETWTSCDDGVQVTHCTITGMEHCWPGNPLVIPGFCATGGLEDIDANEMMYDFFERYALP